MRLKLTLFIFISITAFIFNCSRSDETYTIETKDGVQYVHNHAPLWGDEQRISLEFVRQIGELDTDDENLQFYRPRDIDFDIDGNMYILDGGNCRIQKFDPEGNFILSFGRKGYGPGELQYPRHLEIDNEGNIHVSGAVNKSIQVYNSEGKVLRTYRPGDPSKVFELLENGTVVIDAYYTCLKLKESNDEFPILLNYDQKENLLKEIGNERKNINKPMKFPINSAAVTTDNNDNLYLAYECQNLIEKYAPDGKLLFKVKRDVNFKESTQQEKFTYYSSRGGGGEVTAWLVNEFSNGIQLDSKGRIWVLSYARLLRQEEKGLEGKIGENDLVRFEVYSNEGILLTRIPLPFGHQFHNFKRIYKDRIYLIDEEKQMAVFEYKIVEK